MEEIRQTDGFFYVSNLNVMRRYSYVDCHFFCALGKALFDGLFLFYWACWFFIRFTRLSGVPIPPLNSWLTDFVFVPIIVHFSAVAGSFIFNRGRAYGYPLHQIWLISALASLLFEGIMPHYTDYNTADIYDVIAYFAGGLFYYLCHQPRYMRHHLTRTLNRD